MKLLIATGNAHKLEEFSRILTPLGFEVLSPKQLGIDADIEETGTTFSENARIKAAEMFRLSGISVVADDSGLCVDALGGGPGVYSARYLGKTAPQSEKNAALLAEMENVAPENRQAHFSCAICCMLVNEQDAAKPHEISVEGICDGSIGYAPRGDNGFGYDPIFYIGDKSFAELCDADKDQLSHRGKALQLLMTELKKYI